MEAYFSDLWVEFTANLWLYLSMPVISAVVGYGTNMLALKMMFYPVEFVGFFKPFFGWQGIVPRKAGKMAAISVDTITQNLLSSEEIFDRLDPERVAQELEQPMVDMIDTITDEVMREHMPQTWEAIPVAMQKQIIGRIQADAPAMVAEMMEETKKNMDRMFDLKEMVITFLVRDKDLLNRMIYNTAEPEMKFIANSGAFFGFVFGLIQMALWLNYKGSWLLPVCGLIVGYVTNWIALKLIFEPAEPKKFGPVKVQGLFHKRQNEVAEDYGALVADEIITPSHILEALMKGPYSDKLFSMISRHLQRAIDEQMGVGKQMLALTVGTRTYENIKISAIDKAIAKLPETLTHVTDYAEDAMDIRNTLITRLKGLPPPTFEAMLRPAFEEDEWLLIAVGAGLGLAVGFFQLLVLFA